MSETVLLITACAVATYITRIGGHLILSRFGSIHHRVEAALDAVPFAVLTALVAPSLVNKGWAEALAIIITIIASTRLSMIVTLVTGLISLVVLRQLL